MQKHKKKATIGLLLWWQQDKNGKEVSEETEGFCADLLVVHWQDKNGKEASEETEGKSSRVHRGR